MTRIHPTLFHATLAGEPYGAFTPTLFRHFFEEPPEREEGAFAPRLDLVETPEQYRLSVELPGVRKEDVTIDVHENVLTVHGEKNRTREGGEDEQHRWRERSFGSFHREFRLPPDANASQVEANFASGVLEIAIAKRAEAKPRSVAIR